MDGFVSHEEDFSLQCFSILLCMSVAGRSVEFRGTLRDAIESIIHRQIFGAARRC